MAKPRNLDGTDLLHGFSEHRSPGLRLSTYPPKLLCSPFIVRLEEINSGFWRPKDFSLAGNRHRELQLFARAALPPARRAPPSARRHAKRSAPSAE
jgi:hypothetical protein